MHTTATTTTSDLILKNYNRFYVISGDFFAKSIAVVVLLRMYVALILSLLIRAHTGVVDNPTSSANTNGCKEVGNMVEQCCS